MEWFGWIYREQRLVNMYINSMAKNCFDSILLCDALLRILHIIELFTTISKRFYFQMEARMDFGRDTKK